MRNTFLMAVCAAIVGCSFLHPASALAEKYGYVDLGSLFNEYNKTKDYDKVLGDKQAAYEKERDKRADELKKLQDKMNLLSDKEKEAQKTTLQGKFREIQDFDKQQQTDLRKEFVEKKTEIIKSIDVVIKRFAEKEGYTLIFNEVGVVYNDKALDVTSQILDILNKEYKK